MLDSPRTRLARSPWWLVAIWLLGLAILFKPWVHGTDPVGYYSWLRSAVIDGNLDTTNEYVFYGEDKNDIIFPGPTGYNKNPYAVGSAILWTPFFLAAHVISAIFDRPTDGYASPYIIAASLGSAIYALIGLWLAYRVAAETFDSRAAAWATIGVWWATPLVFYMFSHPIMSHANDAFVNALFVFVWHRTRDARANPGTPRSIRAWVLLGGTLGLAALVRTQNALLVVLLITEAILGWGAARRIDLRLQAAPVLLFASAALLAFTPQMIAWQQTYGAIWPGNPYAVYGDFFDFRSPHFFDVLLSSARGLFVWSPLIVFAAIGLLIYLPRRDRALGLGLAFAWLAQVYLIGSWSAWSAAASFGQRFMIGGTAAYILGLTALLDRLQKRIDWRWLAASIAFFIAWNVLMMAQYIVELIPRAGPVDLGQMVINQFRVISIVVERLESLLAARFGASR